jgi:ribulose-5-phosphate 4-epimerase/fuculose-1-phosphate aldolase
MGFTSPVSGNHSLRVRNKRWMWITPSGIPRYNLHEDDKMSPPRLSGIYHVDEMMIHAKRERMEVGHYQWL